MSAINVNACNETPRIACLTHREGDGLVAPARVEPIGGDVA